MRPGAEEKQESKTAKRASAWRQPIGDKPKSVYVRRRLLVFGLPVLFIVGIGLAILRPGAGSGAPQANEVSVPGDLGKDSKSGQQALKDLKQCQPGQVSVTPVTDSTDYAEGKLPKLSLLVANTGEARCVADLGTSSMYFTITSGGVKVWDSRDCQEGGDTRKVILVPKKPLSTEPIEWDRTLSSPETCTTEREAAQPGSYHLSVSVGGFDSAETSQFLLN